MIFRQFKTAPASRYSYLMADEDAKEAIIIDPVNKDVDLYLQIIADLDLELKYTLNTHIHPEHYTLSTKNSDHISGSYLLKEKTECKHVMHKNADIDYVDIKVDDNDTLYFGKYTLKAIFTPGHTDHHCSYIVDDRLFTGDSLFINGCGRTDFRSGSADMLWASVTDKLFQLPADTLVYPGHDYNNRRVSTIREEIDLNTRFRNKTKEEFMAFMRV
jgi:sulfur dioxygenase